MQSLLDRRPHTNSMVGSPIAGPWLPTHTSEERFWLGLEGGGVCFTIHSLWDLCPQQ